MGLDQRFLKSINDDYGHAVGDRVLQKLSYSVKISSRHNDTVYRVGGEEFAILMVETTAEEARMASDKIRQVILNTEFEKGLEITCSFGVAQFEPNMPENILYENADDALYEAKNNGRNRVTVFKKIVELVPVK